jgi:hypothetical protein
MSQPFGREGPFAACAGKGSNSTPKLSNPLSFSSSRFRRTVGPSITSDLLVRMHQLMAAMAQQLYVLFLFFADIGIREMVQIEPLAVAASSTAFTHRATFRYDALLESLPFGAFQVAAIF